MVIPTTSLSFATRVDSRKLIITSGVIPLLALMNTISVTIHYWTLYCWKTDSIKIDSFRYWRSTEINQKYT